MASKKIFRIILLSVVAFLILNAIYVGYEKIQCRRMINAIENNDIEKLERILKFSNPNCTTEAAMVSAMSQTGRYTPLGEACKTGDFEMVKLLVENGADVNYVPSYTIASPVGFAVESDSTDNLKIVKYLIENGADVNYSRFSQSLPITMLFWEEAEPNRMEILKVLMEAGADPEKDIALEMACAWKHEEAIRYLVEECGYDASDPECIGSYCNGVGEYSYETFEYFLERGANPYEKYYINKYIGEKSAIECLQEESPEWAEKLIDLAASYGITE